MNRIQMFRKIHHKRQNIVLKTFSWGRIVFKGCEDLPFYSEYQGRKKPLVEEEDQNNYNEINNQKVNGNYINSALVKGNNKTQHSDTTGDISKS